MSGPELRWSRPTQGMRLLLCGATAPIAWRVALVVGTLLSVVNQGAEIVQAKRPPPPSPASGSTISSPTWSPASATSEPAARTSFPPPTTPRTRRVPRTSQWAARSAIRARTSRPAPETAKRRSRRRRVTTSSTAMTTRTVTTWVRTPASVVGSSRSRTIDCLAVVSCRRLQATPSEQRSFRTPLAVTS
jgi:hypothetical protein